MPTPIDVASVIERAPDQLATEVADEVVLLGLRNSRYFGLDGVGADVWRWLEQPMRFDALVDAVLAEYDVEQEPARVDLVAFLRELEAEGLVVIGKPAG